MTHAPQNPDRPSAGGSTCPRCGTPLSNDVPSGLCPRCVMGLGFTAPLPVEADPTRSWNEHAAASYGSPDDVPYPLPAAASLPAAAWGGTSLGGRTPRFAPPNSEAIATHFPQLEVLELIGHGGMGAVYKARQRGLDRVVALKILPPDAAADAAFAERFHREARALARLNHPNIVNVYDSGKSGPYFFFVMEFVDGVNLRQAMRGAKVTPNEALQIIPQICDALQYAHDEGVVHRDIKPENVLLDRKGRVKVADFGLAKLLSSEPLDVTLTGTFQIVGTPRYMAPEQMEGARQVDHRADIYSLGVVFYELLTGELPFGRFAVPSQKSPVNRQVDDIVLRTLEKEPQARYQQASELKGDVERLSGVASGIYRTSSVWGISSSGWEYRTEAVIFGWPWIHVATGYDAQQKKAREARGVIAIGGRATGVFALGGQARGLVAIGGVAMGGVALGGVSIGVVALGGIALGVLALGGFSVGLLFALGGIATGLYAVGGLAMGFQTEGGLVIGSSNGHAQGTASPTGNFLAPQVMFTRWFLMFGILLGAFLGFFSTIVFVVVGIIASRNRAKSSSGAAAAVVPVQAHGQPFVNEPATTPRPSRTSGGGALAWSLLVIPGAILLMLGLFFVTMSARVAVSPPQLVSRAVAKSQPVDPREQEDWSWQWTEQGPKATLKIQRQLGLDSRQSKALDEAIQVTWDKYREWEASKLKTQFNGELRYQMSLPGMTKVEFTEYENIFWSNLDPELSEWQQTLARIHLKMASHTTEASPNRSAAVGVTPGLIGWGMAGCQLEVWQVGQWYHWRLATPVTNQPPWNAFGRGVVHDDKAPTLPKEYWRLYHVRPPSETPNTPSIDGANADKNASEKANNAPEKAAKNQDRAEAGNEKK